MTLGKSILEVELGISNFIKNLPNQELYSPIGYIMKLGGKRLRPALAVLANQYYDGKLENIIQPAIGIEVFHNFSLMHDDIMDEAPLRRGKQTVHEKWNANSAILSGDAMLVQAYQLVTQTKPTYIKEIHQLFSQTALEVCEGQQFDMDFEKRDDVSIDEYLEMIKLKTSVLIACALKMGAISAGASEVDSDNMYNFGLNMGIAFQLRDDFLDAFGETHKVGKQQGGDILANKKTYLAIKAKQKASKEQLLLLSSYQSEPDPTVKVNRTLEIFKTLKVNEDIEALSKQYFTTALEFLNKTTGSTLVKEELLTFSKKLMVREH